MLDLCGAGAFGYIMANSGFSQNIYDYLSKAFPVLLLPFLGHRSCSCPGIEGSNGCGIVSSFDRLSFGLFCFSLAHQCRSIHVLLHDGSYFWLIKESVGSGIMEILKGYILPLSLMGLVTFLMVSVSWMCL
jgi:gluconate:H+ symporter, GntP family